MDRLTEIRNALYSSTTSGRVSPFQLLKAIKEHLNNLDAYIDSRRGFLDRIEIGLERELKKQKESGKEFISDSMIDELVDKVISEELKGLK